jgi:SSS family solute:Na+ symporter
MIQRTLVAKTIGDAKKAYTMMGYAAFFIFTLLFSLGIFLYAFFEGASFDNTNTIMLEFVKLASVPGLMGLIAVAIVAAAMSSLDSSLNSMATVTNIDFYQQYFKKDGSPQHYLRAARIFTVVWGLFVIGPAILFTSSDGSVLETLSKIGSFFVGSKLSMYFLGFYSKHTTERGLLLGVAAGFLTLLYVEYFMNIAWPWYCAIGGFVSVTVGWISSIAIDGYQSQYHVCTVRGQRRLFEENGLPLKENGWYILPGKVDSKSYGLIIFFFLCILCLYIFYKLI